MLVDGPQDVGHTVVATGRGGLRLCSDFRAFTGSCPLILIVELCIFLFEDLLPVNLRYIAGVLY